MKRLSIIIATRATQSNRHQSIQVSRRKSTIQGKVVMIIVQYRLPGYRKIKLRLGLQLKFVSLQLWAFSSEILTMMHQPATDSCSSKTQNSTGAWVKCVRYCMFQIAAIMFTFSVQSHKPLWKLKSKSSTWVFWILNEHQTSRLAILWAHHHCTRIFMKLLWQDQK